MDTSIIHLYRIAPYLKKVAALLGRFLYVQLFVTLISLPILISWGMPFSLLTFAGNLVFNQILMIFLLLSSLIFLGAITGIPMGWPVYLLEKLTEWWLWVMERAGHEWLMVLPAPAWYFLVLIGMATLAVCHARYIRSSLRGILAFTLLFMLLCAGIRWFSLSESSLFQVACQNKSIPILSANGEIVVIDPGVIGSRLSARSWCEYTLSQALAQKAGASSIDHFVLMQPNILIFDALAALCQKMTIKKIYIPWWQGRVPPRVWSAFSGLRRAARDCGTQIIRVYDRPVIICLRTNDRLRIKPLKKLVKGDGFTYPCLQVMGKVGTIKVNVYSGHYSK